GGSRTTFASRRPGGIFSTSTSGRAFSEGSMSARMRTLFSSTVIIAVTALACGRDGSVPARRMSADRLDILPTALADSASISDESARAFGAVGVVQKRGRATAGVADAATRPAPQAVQNPSATTQDIGPGSMLVRVGQAS